MLLGILVYSYNQCDPVSKTQIMSCTVSYCFASVSPNHSFETKNVVGQLTCIAERKTTEPTIDMIKGS